MTAKDGLDSDRENGISKGTIMNDRTQEFRVGLMAIAAVSAAVIMVFKFGEIGNSLRSGTRIGIVMTNASGVMPQSSVQMSGIRIGQVESTQLIADGRGVLVSVRIDHEFSFKNDSTAQVQQSLLGDAAIQIIPGTEGRLKRAIVLRAALLRIPWPS